MKSIGEYKSPESEKLLPMYEIEGFRELGRVIEQQQKGIIESSLAVRVVNEKLFLSHFKGTTYLISYDQNPECRRSNGGLRTESGYYPLVCNTILANKDLVKSKYLGEESEVKNPVYVLHKGKNPRLLAGEAIRKDRQPSLLELIGSL